MSLNNIKPMNTYKSNTIVDFYSAGNIEPFADEYDIYTDVNAICNKKGFLNIIYIL